MSMDNLIRRLAQNRGKLLNEFATKEIKAEHEMAKQRVTSTEGKVPKSLKNVDKETVQSLVEAIPDDENEQDLPPEKDMEPKPKPEPKEGDEEDGVVENDKEYFGQKDDNFFYLKKEGEEGTSDLVIVDQEGEQVFSAEEGGLDTSDVFHFILAAIAEVEPSDLSSDLFMRYVKPEIEKLEDKDEGDIGEMEDEPVMQDEEPFERIIAVPFKDRVFEVVATKADDHIVLEFQDRTFRFHDDFCSLFKNVKTQKLDADSIGELSTYILESLSKDEFTAMVEGCGRLVKGLEKGAKKRGIKKGTERFGKYVYGKAAKIEKGKKNESVVDESEINELNIVTQGVKQLRNAAKDALKNGDFESAAEFSQKLATIHSALPEIEVDTKDDDEPEDEGETPEVETKSEPASEPETVAVEGKVPNVKKDSEKKVIDKLTEDDKDKEVTIDDK
jgi:hypothetical protein